VSFVSISVVVTVSVSMVYGLGVSVVHVDVLGREPVAVGGSYRQEGDEEQHLEFFNFLHLYLLLITIFVTVAQIVFTIT
jgi:hypothetical protein